MFSPTRWWSRLALRPKLTLSFLMVSVPPVLVASFIAAQTMSAVFETNVQQWIGEIARFMANEAQEAQEEAMHATSIVAKALSQASAQPAGSDSSLEAFADLLTSVGYDFVRLYDGSGRVLYAMGDLQLARPLPQEPVASIFFAHSQGKPVMLVGAVQKLRLGDADHFLFIGNLLDEQFFNAPQTIRSLDLHLVEVRHEGRKLQDITSGQGRPADVPPDVLSRLQEGADSVSRGGVMGVGPAVAYAALRDGNHHLVGIVICRLNGATALFERLGTWWLFLALAAVAGLLSLLAGIGMSRRLSAPLRQITQGLTSVADGDYRIRLREEGGREIADLAAGFNTMTAQLETLHALEAKMRHSAQLATLGEAAAVIAHEIRNPLGIIKTSTELVRRKTQLAPSEDRLMGFVLEEVNRIERLVADLLDYVRPDHFERHRIDLLAEVVQPAVDFAGAELSRRGISHVLIAPEGPLPVNGDVDRLYQALLNLLLNAADAAPEGGHVIVRLKACSDEVALEVEDNGPGVPPDVEGRMFEPFVTSKANGTGLGLAKVQSTLQAHEGAVSYRKAPGGGAIFSLRLALAEDRTLVAASQ